jgi:3-dehydroquinate synthase
MAVDKKAIDGAVRLVLLKSLGEAYLSENYDADRLRDTLAAFQIAA